MGRQLKKKAKCIKIGKATKKNIGDSTIRIKSYYIMNYKIQPKVEQNIQVKSSWQLGALVESREKKQWQN